MCGAEITKISSITISKKETHATVRSSLKSKEPIVSVLKTNATGDEPGQKREIAIYLNRNN